jgi:hypothetical protein
MPRSKHRHKGSGRARKKPGKAPARRFEPTPSMVAYDQFCELYMKPFSDKWPEEGPHHAVFMLETIAGAAFDAWPPIASTVSKQSIFKMFTTDFEDVDPLSVETAEAALAFLVEEGMVQVDGDQITIPEQFIPKDG